MTLTEQILEVHSRFNVEYIAGYIGIDTQRFDQLIELINTAQYPVRERAAWIMCHCVKAHPFLMNNYCNQFVKQVFELNNQSVLRSILFSLALVNLSAEHAGILYDKCIEILFSDSDIAVRAYAMQILFNIAQTEPALKPELKILFNDILMRGDSKGMEAKARKLLKSLK